MQIYIHIPFCKHKCSYCSFYSEPTAHFIAKAPETSGEPQAVPDHHKTPKKVFAHNMTTDAKTSASPLGFTGLNSFFVDDEEAKRIIQEAVQKENQLSSFGGLGTHKGKKNVSLTSEPQSLASLLTNISKPQNNGVQSLADVLRKSKKTNLSQADLKNAPQGISLADALLAPEQATQLRAQFGLPSPKIPPSPPLKTQTATHHPPPLAFGKTGNGQDIHGHAEEQFTKNAKHHASPKNFASILNNPLSLTEHLSYDQLNDLNDRTRLKFTTSPHKFDHAKIEKKGNPSIRNFQEHNPLSDQPIYRLWLKTLVAELQIMAEFYKNTPITSIFFGGGTPSLIPIKDMDGILRRIFKYFHVIQSAEISMEANPESITKEKAFAYQRMGFNRISLGVQSLDDENLKNLGRVHDAKVAIQAFKQLRNARFHNINLDLMWGLPQQNNKNWRSDIKDVISLDPEHLSLYGLSIEEGSIFDRMEQDGTITLPNDKEQALMYKTGISLLSGAGYTQYEISNFSKMGFQCQHNLGYWQGADYMGLGPSATSTLQGIRRTHAKSIVEWAKDIQFGHLQQSLEVQSLSDWEALPPNPTGKGAEPLCKPHIAPFSTKNTVEKSPRKSLMGGDNVFFETEILSKQDKVLEFLMLRLRTAKGLCLAEYKQLTGRPFMHDNKELINTLSKHDLIRISQGHIYLSPNGMLVSNSILERFFEHTKKVLRLS